MKNFDIRSEKTLNILSKAVFTLYLILCVWVVIFKCNIYLSLTSGYHYLKTLTVGERFNFYLVPFADYLTESGALNMMKLKDGILNLIIFIPFGLYVSFFAKGNKFLKTVIISALAIISVELFQLYSLIGSFQSEDLIINLLGSALGYPVYRLLYKKQNSETRLKALNVISITVIALLAPVAVYAIVNTAANFDLYINMMTKTL